MIVAEHWLQTRAPVISVRVIDTLELADVERLADVSEPLYQRLFAAARWGGYAWLAF